MFLTILSTQYYIRWTLYLYTKSEYKNSNFQSVKAAVDRRLAAAAAAGGWLAAGRWRLVGGGWLPSLTGTFWIEFNSTNLPLKLN